MKRKYDRSGPDVNGWKQKATDRNKSILNSPVFLEACEKAGVTPCTRQASKFSRSVGKAYRGGV